MNFSLISHHQQKVADTLQLKQNLKDSCLLRKNKQWSDSCNHLSTKIGFITLFNFPEICINEMFSQRIKYQTEKNDQDYGWLARQNETTIYQMDFGPKLGFPNIELFYLGWNNTIQQSADLICFEIKYKKAESFLMLITIP